MTQFQQILSRMTLIRAAKFLGADGKQLIREGGKFSVSIEDHVFFQQDRLTVQTPEFTVSLVYDESCTGKIRIESSTGNIDCPEVGAVFSLVLEEKMTLGLAEPPKERVPVESLPRTELVRIAVEERALRAKEERITVKSSDSTTPWTDYVVTNPVSGKSYRVALRGFEPGVSYCACPDFRNNRLGTCKHLIAVEGFARKKFKAADLRKSYRRQRSSVCVRYTDDEPVLMLMPGPDLKGEAYQQAAPYLNRGISSGFTEFAKTIERIQLSVPSLHIHPDAEDMINRRLYLERIHHDMQMVRDNLENHPLRTSLLKTTLRPYQLDGIAFAVQRGRVVLADDMGLGKTIQGVGIAELLHREAQIKKNLIICPASLKSQWREEILRFSDRSVQLVLGGNKDRLDQYGSNAFFTVCNYEQVLRDINTIETVPWDLIILDEAQRIKNWESQTSRIVKSLKSPFALALTGTPMENRLEELYNVVTFIDSQRLGPAYQFLNTHRVADEKGKVLGYKKLDELRKRLQPILLRRTRQMVLDELPERTTHIVRIEPYEEQASIDMAQRKLITQILSKKYVTEMDLLRLQQALLTCRMAADCTFLVNKQTPYYSTKLERMRELIPDLLRDKSRKIVLFSEWTTMLDLIQNDVVPKGIQYVRLDGSVPQKMRGGLVKTFRESPECRMFLTTNAGSTGLNLQAANTVINVDLPWNPAILEQRIGRAHRMGQKRPVDVYILVSEGMFEEKLLGILGAKKELAGAAIDFESELSEVSMETGFDELKRRLEVLIAPPETKPLDKSMQVQASEEVRKQQEKQMSAACGKMLSAAFDFLGASVQAQKPAVDTAPLTNALFSQFAGSSEKAEDGSFNLKLNLDESALRNLASTLATIMQATNS